MTLERNASELWWVFNLFNVGMIVSSTRAKIGATLRGNPSITYSCFVLVSKIQVSRIQFLNRVASKRICQWSWYPWKFMWLRCDRYRYKSNNQRWVRESDVKLNFPDLWRRNYVPLYRESGWHISLHEVWHENLSAWEQHRYHDLQRHCKKLSLSSS